MTTRSSTRTVKRKVDKDFIPLSSLNTKKNRAAEALIADVEQEKHDGTLAVASDESANQPQQKVNKLSKPRKKRYKSSSEILNNTSDVVVNKSVDSVNLENHTGEQDMIRRKIEGTHVDVATDANIDIAGTLAPTKAFDAEILNDNGTKETGETPMSLNVSERLKMQNSSNILTSELKCVSSPPKPIDEAVNKKNVGVSENSRSGIKKEPCSSREENITANTGMVWYDCIQNNGTQNNGEQNNTAQNDGEQNGTQFNCAQKNGAHNGCDQRAHDSEQIVIKGEEIDESIKPAGLMDVAKLEIKLDSCPKLLKSEQSLTRHRSTYTGDDKSHLCVDCGQVFSRKCYLVRHRMTHSGEKRFCCEVCGKGFTRNSSLTIHLTSHTGERKFACDLCDKSFKLRHSLKAHRNTHIPEKMLICHLCGKSFSSQEYLRQHMKHHSGTSLFRCDLCNKTVRTKQSMLEHMLRHNGQKNISCQLCSKRFYNKKELSVHMKFHSNVSDFQCKICHMYFKLEKSLEAHQSRMHGHRYTCHICDKHFSSQRALQTHVFHEHPDQRATRKNKLLKHETANFKKATCIFCGKTVSNKYRLKKHVLKKHGQKQYLIHNLFSKVNTGNEKTSGNNSLIPSQTTTQEVIVSNENQNSVLVEELPKSLTGGVALTSSMATSALPTSARTSAGLANTADVLVEVGKGHEANDPHTPIMVIYEGDAPNKAVKLPVQQQLHNLSSNSVMIVSEQQQLNTSPSNAVVIVSEQQQLNNLPTFLQDSMDTSIINAISDQKDKQRGSKSGPTIYHNDQAKVGPVSSFVNNEEVVIFVNPSTDSSAEFDTKEHSYIHYTHDRTADLDTREHSYIHYTRDGEELDQVAEEVVIQPLGEDGVEMYNGVEYIEIDGTHYPYKPGAQHDQESFHTSAVTVKISGSTSDAVFVTPALHSAVTSYKTEDRADASIEGEVGISITQDTSCKTEHGADESLEGEEGTSKTEDTNNSASETLSVESQNIVSCYSEIQCSGSQQTTSSASLKTKHFNTSTTSNQATVRTSKTKAVDMKHAELTADVTKLRYLNIPPVEKPILSSKLGLIGDREAEENQVPGFKTENMKLLETNVLSKSLVFDGDSDTQQSKLGDNASSTVDVIVTKRETESPASGAKSMARSSTFDNVLPQTESREEFARFEKEVCGEIKKLRKFDQYAKFLDNMLLFVQHEQSKLMFDKHS